MGAWSADTMIVAVPPGVTDPPPAIVSLGTSLDTIVVDAAAGLPIVYAGSDTNDRVTVFCGSTSPLSRVGTWSWAELAPAGMTNGLVGGRTSLPSAVPPVDTVNVSGLVGATDVYTMNVAGWPLVVCALRAYTVSTGVAAAIRAEGTRAT